MIEPTKENINILVHAVEVFENAFLNGIALTTDDYRMSPIFSEQNLSYDDIESIRKRANMAEWDESQCLLDIICEGYEHLYQIDLNEVIDECIEEFKNELEIDKEISEPWFWCMEEAAWNKLESEEAVYTYIKSQDSVYNKDDELKLQKMVFNKIKQLKEEKSKHAEE